MTGSGTRRITSAGAMLCKRVQVQITESATGLAMTTDVYKILATASLCLAMFFVSGMLPTYAEVVEKPLVDADCIKCHIDPSVQIIEHGGGHKTALGCFDCHEGHPPAGSAVIPECAQCHAADAHAHYALDNCQECHAPHAPGIEDLSKVSAAVPAVCLTCHEHIGTALKEIPSMHAQMACTDCHLQHGVGDGQFMQCLDCHSGHTEEMKYADCLGCHAPHQPTDYRWDADTPVDHCAACHDTEVEHLKKSGGAHYASIGCSDCHGNHPPAQEDVIPECAECHDPDDAPHYAVGQCAECHDPHAPLEVKLDAVSPVKPVCLSCHAEPGKEMKQHPSMHAEMDCMECHAQHGEASSCLDCHSGHSESMTYAQCFRCHQPHSPKYIQFKQGHVEPQLCGSCHDSALEQLEANATKHAALECVFCHRRTHKVILGCKDCHGEPHDAVMHRQFSDCGQCHRGPHNLRN